MNGLSSTVVRRLRWLVAALAGGALALAFPGWDVAGLAWAAPALMLLAALGCAGGAAWRLGYLAGLVWALVSLHWLLFIPVKFAPVLGWLALAGYVAVYPATWVWLCLRLMPGHGAPDTRARLEAFAAAGWARRQAWALACAVIWVALEMLRARLLTGFPWNLLGVSQHKLLPLLRVAEFTGVYGVSLLVAWVSVALFGAGVMLAQSGGRGRGVLAPALVLPVLAAGAAWWHGSVALWRRDAGAAELRVALVQPAVPQTLIWDERGNAARFERLLALSREALAEKPDLLVWPEAATPSLPRQDAAMLHAITNLAREHRVWMVVGADDAEPHPREPGRAQYFNAAFLISPEGALVDRYAKRHLVMFGEYVPLSRWLPFLRHLTPIGEGFTPGDGPRLFDIGGVRASVLICFEDVLPHHAREHAHGADFLLNLTNDGWFGESAAQAQHAANALFRAIENGLPLVRCTNNGLTCRADPAGRLLDTGVAGGGAFGQGWRMTRVALEGRETFYRRHGDAFGWSCVVLTVGLAALGRRGATYKRGEDRR